MPETSKQQATQEIAHLVKSAYDNLALAQALADEHKLEFSFSPAYGMGGTYYGYPSEDKWDYRDEPGWQSSSSTC